MNTIGTYGLQEEYRDSFSLNSFHNGLVLLRMKTLFFLKILVISSVLLFSLDLYAEYSERVCQSPLYDCYEVKKGESWESLFSDPNERMIVKKINRMNIAVHPGMIIAIPKDKHIEPGEFLTYAPFPLHIPTSGEEMLKVQLSTLAWGAYDEKGTLVRWGPISAGKSHPITGTYTFYRKQGAGCTSSKYPLPNGGAPMPYCMHFKGGYAVHGSPVVPGYHASHGCVRIFTDDAQWLNQYFVDTGSTKVQISE